ncbi:hypothetical protein KKE14_03245 [Patescibacteria group bacterium]|nr:hypothetical protein [Patescibacteria group bacterium]
MEVERPINDKNNLVRDIDEKSNWLDSVRSQAVNLKLIAFSILAIALATNIENPVRSADSGKLILASLISILIALIVLVVMIDLDTLRSESFATHYVLNRRGLNKEAQDREQMTKFLSKIRTYTSRRMGLDPVSTGFFITAVVLYIVALFL